MMMNPDQENFDDLRKLLALKRHEQPPPGYLDSLPRKIQTRLQREQEEPRISLFARLFSDRIKPALAYSFVLSVCALMAFAVNSFLHLEGQSVAAGDSTTGAQNRVAVLGARATDYQAAAPWAAAGVADNSASPSAAVLADSSNSPSLLPLNSLAAPQLPFLRAQPASFQIPGGR